MIASETATYRLGDVHEVSASGHRFLYMGNAGAIFEIDGAAAAVVDQVRQSPVSREQLLSAVNARGLSLVEADELIGELVQSRIIITGERVHEPLQELPDSF